MRVYIIQCAYTVGFASAQGSSYAIAFMNITPDTNEQGFVQLFAVTTNISVINVQVANMSNLLGILLTATPWRKPIAIVAGLTVYVFSQNEAI